MRHTLCPLALLLTLAASAAAQTLPAEPAPPTTSPLVTALPTPPATQATIATTTQHEDLSTCLLISGELELPLPLAAAQYRGNIIRLADQQRAMLPIQPGKPAKDVLESMRKDRLGDLFYSSQAEGSFLIISGKAADLGAKYLYECADQSHPLPQTTGLDPAKPRQLAGTLPTVQEGHTYLIECTDGKYALVRVLRKGLSSARIQYVYQPDGTTVFAVPKGTLSPVPAAEPTTLPALATLATMPAAPVTPPNGSLYKPDRPDKPEPTITLTPATPLDPAERVLEPYIETHLLQRRKMIDRRIGVVRAPAVTDREIAAKTSAMEELGKLRAVESVEPLLDQITFQNTRAKPRHFSPDVFHPAVAALKELGKPASAAALAAIGTLKPDGANAPEDPLKTSEYRLHLLTMVIKGIEGPDAAEFLLTREMQKVQGDPRSMYEQAIKYLREP